MEVIVVSPDNLHLEKAVPRLIFHPEGVADPGMGDEPRDSRSILQRNERRA